MSGKGYAGALGAVALLLVVAGALFGLKGTGTGPVASLDVASLLLLALAGMVLDVMSNPLAHYGYICLGFFTAFFTLARPAELTGDQSLALPSALGQALLVAGVGMLPRLASLGQSWTHVFSYLGINMLRLVVVGLPFLAIRGANPIFSWQTLAGAVVSIGIYLFFDATIAGLVTNEVEDNAERRIWAHVIKRARLVLVAPVPLSLLAVAFAAGAAKQLPAPPAAAVVAGLALGFLGIVVVRTALRSAADELVVQDQEQLELALRTSQHHEKRLKEDNLAVTEELKAKQTELDLINEMARELGASTTLADTLSTVQKMIRRHRIPYQSCVIFLVKDRDSMLLYPALADTPYKEVLEMSPLLQLQEQLITQVMQEQRSQMVGEMSASSEQRIFKDERSVICVPLTVTKEIVGVIYLGSINAKTHKEEHLEKLKMLATFAAPSIKTAVSFETKEQDLRSERQMREAVEAQKKLLEGLQKMGQDLGKTLKIDSMLQTVVDNLKRMLPQGQSVIVFTVGQDDPHALETRLAHSPYQEFVKSTLIRNDEGLVGKATELKSTLLVKDTAVYDLQNIIAYERSVIVAPLIAENSVLGCLYVGATKEASFTEENRNLVETVSYQAAIAIKNAILYEQTQQMALTDGLTGLYTHRHFQVRLSEEIEWSERSGKPIVLVMVDTDHFKSFNDTLGHPAGDALLKEIAALLKDKVRSTDIVCRYGGDEFALILRDAPKDQAVQTCERIRESFQLRFAAMAVQVTSSIGMACFPSDARNKKDLAKAADDAMYVSKRNGRNKVTPAPTLEEKSREGYQEVVQETLSR